MTIGDSQWGQDMADEVVGAFATLYPKLSLPLDVWTVLHEMISRECTTEVGNGASALLTDQQYIDDAVACGLR